jgi:hypothetical protein
MVMAAICKGNVCSGTQGGGGGGGGGGVSKLQANLPWKIPVSLYLVGSTPTKYTTHNSSSHYDIRSQN